MKTDVLIIGCGIAGATAALELAKNSQCTVTLVTRSTPTDSNSSYAQGGIVSRGVNDSSERLIKDVMKAGAKLSYLKAVEVLAREGPELVSKILIDELEVGFDPDFGLEAAHSTRRILHVADETGKEITKALLAKLNEYKNIRLLTQHTAVDLITFPHHSSKAEDIYKPPRCYGAYILDQKQQKVKTVAARATILATGGVGQLFLYTSNPSGARGDGIAMAYRAGARIENAEYVQFHPTVLSMQGEMKLLISEAIRGEGGRLITPGGKFFDDLDTRDVVARAIYSEMLTHNYPHVFLDIASYRSPKFIRQRFPYIYQQCLRHRIDITHDPIPVVPAAHYFCGGVLVDLWGGTSIPGLYAVGEVTCTGVHGANRLASTSLLEGLVWGARTAREILRKKSWPVIPETRIPPWDDAGLVYDPDPAIIAGDMQTIRNLMWFYVGLVRKEYLLARAMRELRHLFAEIEDFYRKTKLTDGLIGLRNSIQAALLIAQAAKQNKVSRGCHYRV